MKALAVLLAFVFVFSASAQVQDNSFLIEEAYNQEPGEVQHVNMLLRDRDSDSWIYSFSQEWPIRSLKHQFSYTIPIGSFDGDTQLGDVTLSYRYQWIGDGAASFAVAPSVSLILPTGEGSDDAAVEIGLPLSKVLTARLRAHTNLGATWYSYDHSDPEVFIGQSLVYAITSRLDGHIEALWSRDADDSELLISPGIRWAYDLPSGLQIVPGVAYVRGDDGADAALLYLSFEK